MAEITALAFVEQGGGTTARRQRYNRSVKAGEHQGPAVQPLQGVVQPLGRAETRRKDRGNSLSHTTEEDKEGVRKVYVN